MIFLGHVPLALVFLAAFSLNAFASENPFENFLGSYSVLSATCTYNGSPSIDNCDQTEISIQSPETKNMLELKETFVDGSVAYPLYERDYSDQFWADHASVEASAPNAARWTHSLSLSDGRRTYEVREIKKSSEIEVTYSFYYKERSLFGNEFVITRNYRLNKK